MKQNRDIYYSALASCDPRFDGVFFVGVTSTGIYCRPICPARKPKPENCEFFGSAAAAEKASFRPCLRCRPELAPGYAPVDDSQRIAQQIAGYIEEGLYQEGTDLDDVAAEFELSSRQIRRIVHNEYGVSPIELILTRRLLLAKQLLTDTSLPVTEIAFASGFSSLRRFNDAFLKRYGMPPSRLRKEARKETSSQTASESLTLQLSYRAPFDWEGLLHFLQARASQGVEHVEEGRYQRTISMAGHSGWISVTNNPGKGVLHVELSHSLTPILSKVLKRVRELFDLNARPDIIMNRLSEDPFLEEAIQQIPGVRIPGAIDGFEVAVRAILGQQITVKAATTLAGRFAEAFGTPIDTPHTNLTHIFPTPQRVAKLSVDDVASQGIIQRRAECIIEIARRIASEELKLTAATSHDVISGMTSIKGIGPWTANYVAMRVIHWPDAFPKEDVVLRKKMGGLSAKEAEQVSQKWRPWRSYAAMYVWRK